MTNKEIIDGLKYTMDMCLFDANTGEYDSKESLNDMTRTTYDACEGAIKALEQQPCEDCISRESLRQKLQENYDFFVNAYGGFGNLPQSDKPRVDEIDNCIAMVVDEPSVTPQRPKGKWMVYAKVEFGDFKGTEKYKCSECGHEVGVFLSRYCPNCGAEMGGADETN